MSSNMFSSDTDRTVRDNIVVVCVCVCVLVFVARGLWMVVGTPTAAKHAVFCAVDVRLIGQIL